MQLDNVVINGQRVTWSIGTKTFDFAWTYTIPRTAVLDALLLTAYLGGATATHVRMGQPFFFPAVSASSSGDVSTSAMSASELFFPSIAV